MMNITKTLTVKLGRVILTSPAAALSISVMINHAIVLLRALYKSMELRFNILTTFVFRLSYHLYYICYYVQNAAEELQIHNGAFESSRGSCSEFISSIGPRV